MEDTRVIVLVSVLATLSVQAMIAAAYNGWYKTALVFTLLNIIFAFILDIYTGQVEVAMDEDESDHAESNHR